MSASLRKTAEYLVFAGAFVLPFSKSVLEWVMVTALVLWLGSRSTSGQKKPPLPPLAVFYFLFLGLTLVSVTQAGPGLTGSSFRGFLKWLKFVGIFFMLCDLGRDAAFAHRLVGVFLFSAVLTALNGFIQMIAGQDLIKGYSVDIPGRLVRMRSSFGSPNGLATFLLFAMTLTFGRWLENARWKPKSALDAALLALLSVAFILTLSRAAFFALGLGVLGTLATRRRWKAVGILFFTFVLFFLPSAMVRENFLASLSFEDITIGERLHFWKVTLDMIRESPWLGHGVNTYYKKFAEFAPAAEGYRGYAHNCYLQMWSEIGFFGLQAFLIPLLAGLWAGLRLNMAPSEGVMRDALGAGLAAFLIQSAFDTHFYALQMAYLFWTFWGLWTARLNNWR